MDLDLDGIPSIEWSVIKIWRHHAGHNLCDTSTATTLILEMDKMWVGLMCPHRVLQDTNVKYSYLHLVEADKTLLVELSVSFPLQSNKRCWIVRILPAGQQCNRHVNPSTRSQPNVSFYMLHLSSPSNYHQSNVKPDDSVLQLTN